MAANGKVNDRSNEITLTRIYNAPVKVVWEAWTDVEQVAKWWGPRGFTLTSHSKELKPGGKWIYTMHGPDGTDFPNTTLYHEVERYSRLVYDHGGADNTPPLFRVTVDFVDLKDTTRMEMTMALPSKEAAERTKKFIKVAGGDSTWDRLGEYLILIQKKKECFVINRSFDASIATLFEMWSNPNHFSQWLAPTGFHMEFIRSDIKAGGSTFYFMSNGSMKMYGRAKYVEIHRPNRLVYTQQFVDEKENISRHPMVPVWPETMLTSVRLIELNPSTTLVTILWEPHGQVTKEETEAFIKMKGSMTQGWTGSFDKLDQYLSHL